MADLPMNQKPGGAGLPILPGPPKVKDPVCGMSVDPAKAAGKVEHKSKAYYFCSKRCAERFAQDPETFLAAPGTAGMGHGHAHAHAAEHTLEPSDKPHGSAAGASAPFSNGQGVRYTCPMHPEVAQIGPGVCPKCGMALEPMDVFAEVEADPEYDSMRRRFWVSAALSLPVLLLSMLGDALGLRMAHSVRNVIELDRKSTRLNSSHMSISYAVFCLKKKTTKHSPIYNPHEPRSILFPRALATSGKRPLVSTFNACPSDICAHFL